MEQYRPTEAIVDLKNLEFNINSVKKNIGSGVELMPVVKASAYGHGGVEISKKCIDLKCENLGVATIEEGVELRNSGITSPILILGSIWPFSNFETVVKYNLTPTIASVEGFEQLVKFATRAKERKARVPFHLKVDTGMGRIGLTAQSALELSKKIVSSDKVFLEGIYSHLASADSDHDYTTLQINSFNELLNKLISCGINPRYKHIANSAAVLEYPNSHFNLVRVGLLIYGLLPFAGAEKKIEVKPLLTLKTAIIFVKKVPKGTSISYGSTFTTEKESIVATLPIGYADGLNRLLSNRGQVLIKGKRVPIVGRVCMDMCMVDVTALGGASVGDEVVIIGKQGDEKISAEDIADEVESINYEVMTNISKRVPRKYIW